MSKIRVRPRPERAAHVRRVWVEGQRSMQLTLNQAAYSQVMAALTFLKDNVSEQDPEFNAFVAFLAQADMALEDGDEDVFDYDPEA